MKSKLLHRIACIVIAILSASLVTANGADNELQFNTQGRFKIVQFTDIHWKNGSPKCDNVLQVMTNVLDSEKPDLVILTGDIVTSSPAKKGWEAVIKPMTDRKIPWVAILGNHDDEHDMTRKEIISLLASKPYSFTTRGPEDIAGEGNFILKIKSHKNLSVNAAALYCIDSLAYSETYLAMSKDERKSESKKPNPDYYAWIKPSQIEWYRKISKGIAKNNGGKPLPSLAFFHIPLPEFKASWESKSPAPIGSKKERVCCPSKNTGMFSAMVECGDVMGVFVGHDHVNDYAGLVQGICLAYGRATGFDTYGNLIKGARVIELIEGKREFDTWIRTGYKKIHYKVHYPASFNKTSTQQKNASDKK
jgi:hypothetical protein